MTDFQPLFVDGRDGRIFVVHYPPAAPANGRCVLVLPAFAEEMNKCRRQVALQARAIAARGSAVVIADLRGTGDSDGALGDARLEEWIDDLGRVLEFARGSGYASISLLAIRAGALLVAPFLAATLEQTREVVLWHPPASGRLFVNQFLRMKVASGMMAGDGVSVKDLRAQLDDGQVVEVGGYPLAPGLVAALDELELSQIGQYRPQRIDWIGLGQPGTPPPLVAQRIVDDLTAAGAEAHYQACDGDPFWATAEIATSAAFIDATCAALS